MYKRQAQHHCLSSGDGDWSVCEAGKYSDYAQTGEMCIRDRNHIGCLFWGPVGTGKSYVAGCIANDLLKREVTVKMTNFNTIIDDIFPLADKTESVSYTHLDVYKRQASRYSKINWYACL